MIRCEQKGPHQQVRSRLALSVLPTARGLLPWPVLPTASHPGLCPRLCKEGVDRPAREEAPATTLASPQHPITHPPTRHRMVTHHCKVFLELPHGLGPSTPTLESPHLQSGPFWKPEDPHWDLEACTDLGSQAKPSPPLWHSLPNKQGSLRAPWGDPGAGGLSGGRDTIAHFLLP